MALALTACGRFTVMPPPDGEPVVLKPAELATTWTDAEGGTLALKPDGTFIADKVCVAVPLVRGFDLVRNRHLGARLQREAKLRRCDLRRRSPRRRHHPETGEREPDSYDALRQGKVLKLWVAVGDPDNDYPNCVLTSPAS